jgi:RHS repeat-associated protein
VNENETQPAYFDDFEITHKANPQKLTVSSWAEYYAFGKVAKASCSGAGSYRYGYQGEFAEKDQETDWNSFELRQYDSEIGRWLSTDPYGQYWSPYVGMGNDPVNQVDPDGGLSGDSGGQGGGCPDCPNLLPEVTVTPGSGVDMSFVGGMQMDNLMRNLQQQDISRATNLGNTKNDMSGPGPFWKMITNYLKNLFKVAPKYSTPRLNTTTLKSYLRTLRTTITENAQQRHLKDTPEWHKAKGGYFHTLVDAQKVLNAVHSGQATYLGVTKGGQQVFRYGGVTGFNNNPRAGYLNQPTNVFIIKGTTTDVSVVPTNPNWQQHQ